MVQLVQLQASRSCDAAAGSSVVRKKTWGGHDPVQSVVRRDSQPVHLAKDWAAWLVRSVVTDEPAGQWSEEAGIPLVARAAWVIQVELLLAAQQEFVQPVWKLVRVLPAR